MTAAALDALLRAAVLELDRGARPGQAVSFTARGLHENRCPADVTLVEVRRALRRLHIEGALALTARRRWYVPTTLPGSAPTGPLAVECAICGSMCGAPCHPVRWGGRGVDVSRVIAPHRARVRAAKRLA